MFFIIRFLIDNVYHVCSEENIKSFSKTIKAKWLDGKFYEAEKICRLNIAEEYIPAVQDVCKNINLGGYPMLKLHVLDKQYGKYPLTFYF